MHAIVLLVLSADPFKDTVRPFLDAYCVRCHDAKKKSGDLDLARFKTAADLLADFRQWEHVIGFVKKEEMPPTSAKQPSDAQRKEALAAMESVLLAEARKLDGEPGAVPPRRLTNAEYDNTLSDIAGVPIRAAFPIDPSSGEGFTNTGEALTMSPALFKKWYAAAEHAASHALLTPSGLRFAPHPAIAFADRQKVAESAILAFYERHRVDVEKQLVGLWTSRKPEGKYQHALLGLLEGKTEDAHVVGWLRKRWKAVRRVEDVRVLAADIRRLSKALTPVETPAIVAHAGNAPIEHLARRRRTAETRDTFDAGLLKLQTLTADARSKVVLRSKVRVAVKVSLGGKKGWSDSFILDGTKEIEVPEAALPAKGKAMLAIECRPVSATARVWMNEDALPLPPLGDAPEYAASASAFCKLFPSRFHYVDETRGLSAGFHLIEGFFRDDRPLCRSVLTEAENAELDRLWDELRFITGIWEKMLRGFVFFERSERNFLKHPDFDSFKEEDPELPKDETLARFQAVYLRRSNVKLTGEALEAHPIRFFFREVREGLKWQEETWKNAEPTYRRDLLAFAEKAYRRPLHENERKKLSAFYDGVRKESGIEAAVRASLIRVLVSPHFAMRFSAVPAGEGVAPLPGLDLASRLSYFLWAGPPDAELLAAAGKLHEPKVMKEQVARMIRSPKLMRFSREFFGQWLGYHDFLTRDSVSKAAFPTIDDLRPSMAEEPTRLATHLIQEGKPITALLDGDETFVDAKLARHYGYPATSEWVKVDGLRKKGRAGVLGMAVFLTRNSQPERTSPVKRGFWVIHKVLGEHIPPPPPDIAVLPAKETGPKTVRQMLAAHVADMKCARCHVRFDGAGLAMEGFDPIGRSRSKDAAGRKVDDVVTMGGKELHGVPAFASWLAKERGKEFERTLLKKLLGYALGRSLQLSDKPLLERMEAALEKGDLRPVLERIAISRQFREQRQKDFAPEKFVARKER